MGSTRQVVMDKTKRRVALVRSGLNPLPADCSDPPFTGKNFIYSTVLEWKLSGFSEHARKLTLSLLTPPNCQ